MRLETCPIKFCSKRCFCVQKVEFKNKFLNKASCIDGLYIIGVLFGDGSLRKSTDREIAEYRGFQVTSKDEEFIDLIEEAFQNTLGIGLQRYEDQHDFTKAMSSKSSVGRVLHKLEWRSDSWRVPDFMYSASDDKKLAFVQGFMDSDGTVFKRDPDEGYYSAKTEIVNRQGLKDLQNILSSIGYKSSIFGPYSASGKGKQDVSVLSISITSDSDLSKLFRMKRKRELLE